MKTLTNNLEFLLRLLKLYYFKKHDEDFIVRSEHNVKWKDEKMRLNRKVFMLRSCH